MLVPDRINELSRQDYGLFARGSKTILEVYKKCLNKHGIKGYFVGQSEVHNDKIFKLLKIGKSHVVGRNFFFERKS